MSTQSSPAGKGHALAATLKRRVFSLPTLLSFAIAVAFIAFLATRFDLDLDQTWENVRTMDRRLYLLAFALHYISFGLRAVRWRALARNATVDETVSVKLPSAIAFLQIVLIGWFVNSIAWLRLGDAYRAYLFSERSGGSFSRSLGTLLAERVLDLATVFVLIGAGALFVSANSIPGAFRYVIVAAFLIGSALVLLVLMKRFGGRLALVLPGRLAGAYHRFERGTLGSLKGIPFLLTLSLLVWLLDTSRLYFVIQSLDLTITIPLVLIVTMGYAILSTVPTPGGIGAVEVGVTGLLVLAGMARSDAGSVVLVDRSISYLSVIVIGGFANLAWQLTTAGRRPVASTLPAATAEAGHTESHPS